MKKLNTSKLPELNSLIIDSFYSHAINFSVDFEFCYSRFTIIDCQARFQEEVTL